MPHAYQPSKVSAEDARRKLQRDLGAESRRLRQENPNMTKMEISKLLALFKRKALTGTTESKRSAKRAEKAVASKTKREGQKASKIEMKAKKQQQLDNKYDVVVIPVFTKQDSPDELLAFASKVKAALRSTSLDVHVDDRTSLTPGQKFAAHEFNGVRLRVEIGTRELMHEKLTVNVNTTPGVPGRKITDVTLAKLGDVLLEAKAQIDA